MRGGALCLFYAVVLIHLVKMKIFMEKEEMSYTNSDNLTNLIIKMVATKYKVAMVMQKDLLNWITLCLSKITEWIC